MTNVYMFSYESMEEDLLDNNIKEEDLKETIDKILGELRLGKMIEINENYIVGYMTGFLLLEKYKISTYKELLI